MSLSPKISLQRSRLIEQPYGRTFKGTLDGFEAVAATNADFRTSVLASLSPNSHFRTSHATVALL